MRLTELLTQLGHAGVELRVNRGKLVCKARKGALTADLAAAIRDNKPALIDLISHADRREPTTDAIPVVADGQRRRLTTAQESLVFRQRLEPGSPFLTLPGAWHLRGDLDVAALATAIGEFYSRHEIIRALIRQDEKGSYFVVGEDTAPELPVVEITANGKEDQHTRLISYLEEQGRQYLDFENGPMFRCQLIRLEPEHHVLFIAINHLVWDGWSYDIFLDEIDRSYRRQLGDESVVMPELPIQYPDYAEWHRDWVDSEDVRRQISAVAESLEDYSKHFEVPTDYRRPAEFGHDGSTESLEFPASIGEKIDALCNRYRVTPFMVLVAVLNFVFCRFSRQSDIAIGSHIQNRTRSEVDNLVGFFVNTAVIRTQVDESKQFADLLKSARASCLSAIENRHVPIDALVREMSIQPDLGNLPLVQVFFSYQDTSDRTTKIGDVCCQSVIRAAKTADADLTVWIRNHGDRLDGGFDYRTDLYSRQTIQSLLSAFKLTLAAVTVDPEVPLSAISLVTPTQHEAHVRDWVRADEPVPATSIFGMIRSQIERVPDNPALSFADDSIDYREFGAQVDKLSHTLAAAGIGRGAVVGVNLDRSIDLIVCLTSILRLGAAYLPLDPKLPADRLSFISQDAAASVVVTDAAERPAWLANSTNVLALDELKSGHTADGDPAAAETPGQDDPAYMIYTSGSTGKPKGVVVSQGNVVNFLAAMAELPGIAENDRLLAVTTCAFDISVLEMFLPLSVGAEVVIASDEEARDARSLSGILESKGITVFQSTPATWRMLVGSGWQGKADLKALCGGEALSDELARSLRPLVASLHNMYGPTETTVWSSVAEIETVVAERIPLGRPIRNTEIYLLDPVKQLVPQGAVGELYIGGRGVTLGYHERPELTADRFVPSPFTDGTLLYGTGDLVRIGGSGELEFHGRIDDQIKVRGYRIELGEIESALQSLEQIAQAAVTLRKYSDDDHRLLAFLVAASPGNLSTGQLRKELRKILPDYMIPQHLTEVESLPLTPSGKVDRKALPDIDLSSRRTKTEPPATYAEKRLADIWMKAIGVDQVDRRDLFFELGGHSLLAMQVIAEIEKDLGRQVSAGSLMLDNLQQIASALGLEEPAAETREQPEKGQAKPRGALGALRSLIGQ